MQKVVTADGRVLLDRGTPAGTKQFEPAIAENVTAAMEPIAAASRSHGLAGGRPSAAKTGTAQLGDTGDNRDAWMVGYTPSLSTAVWVGTADGGSIKNANGQIVYGSGLPADIWKQTMDDALDGTPEESFPDAPAIESRGGGSSDDTDTYVPQTTQQRRNTSRAPVTTTESPLPTTTTQPPAPTTSEPPPTTEPEITTTRSQPPTTSVGSTPPSR